MGLVFLTGLARRVYRTGCCMNHRPELNHQGLRQASVTQAQTKYFVSLIFFSSFIFPWVKKMQCKADDWQ